jgi:cytochrome c-type biogenesis protein CcmE
VGSMVTNASGVDFLVVDETSAVPVEYVGTLPQLFQEGGGVVV